MTDMEMETSGVAPKIAAEIRTIYTRTQGVDLAHEVLASAKSKESVLHDYFVWDDTEAAQKYRLRQADELIRRVRVRIIEGVEQPPFLVRAYVSANRMAQEGVDQPDGRPVIGRYLAIEEVAGQTRNEAAILASIRHDLERLRAKYSGVEQFSQIVRQTLLNE